MMRMYAITVFKSFQGHVVGPPTQSTVTILDQLFVVRPVDFARLATFRSPCFFLRILLDLFLLLYLLLYSLRFRYVYTLKMVSTTKEIQRSEVTIASRRQNRATMAVSKRTFNVV